jgi:hypothetical protein
MPERHRWLPAAGPGSGVPDRCRANDRGRHFLPSSTTGLGFGCISAPPAQRQSELAGPLVLTPNPVTPGEAATLQMGVTTDDMKRVGWGAHWEGWTGTQWVATHVLEHGFGGPGRIAAGEPGATTTIPAIAYFVPAEGFQITIPEVPPDWYRISERCCDITGHLPVEVISPG